MKRTDKQESSVIRLTRWEVSISYPKKVDKSPSKSRNYTVYGVDSEGNERVYAKVSSRQWGKWSETDPLWIQARSAMFESLLSNPRTRDIVIKIKLQGALKKGDKESAIKLWNFLSESAKAELLAKTKA